ncbi:MAG: TOBE domain-containing protein [Synergistes sp.]|nr:TOBE domain-containing protein [Synergistes sp.]
MKLSARNQFAGTVKAVAEGAVNAEVAVTLDGGEEITSIITMTSAKKLALAPGKKVLVVVKASDVMVGVEA